ncbi:HepT-like ribonuclease domain-containing protein [Propionibacterium acidifaciens]|uniref:HepT-like ribonuclease domain-containing protein n=1 Tax=Propionibacterium acidifaciens TaxID=556499 RepID=UPI0028E6EBDE|nr:HepT-like ribonuclease domain-containing protein [Propionibacterium acidifaciens]
MSRARRSADELIAEALEHFSRAVDYSHRDLSDQLTLDAVAMRLSAGIETLTHVDDVVLMRILGEQWRSMRGMRNRLAHGYAFIDAVVVRTTVERNLPPVVEALESHLNKNGWCR